jgi:glycosyltransferase involved in cell wall biosynthesis
VTHSEVPLPDQNRRVDVSIVLPVHNEIEHLDAELERIRAAMDASVYSYELIVVDDGSTDGSGEHLDTVHGIRLLRFRENRGSGSARRAGTQAACGQIVVWTDVDMTYPNADIPRLIDELEGYDQVVGVRNSEQGTTKAIRVPAKWLIRKLASFLARKKIPDLNSGFRAFRTDVARQYLNQLPSGFSCVSTITLTFLANGYSVKYVPIEYARRAGKSKFHWRKDTARYAAQVVRMALSYDPLRVFMPIGLLLFLLSAGKLAYDIIDKDFRLAANTLLLFFAALLVIAVGLLADLTVRLNRPREQVEPATLGRHQDSSISRLGRS